MKAIIAPDAARTPGVAVICLYDAPGAGPADVAIYSGDGKYLSASGWQESRVSLPVDAHDDDSGCLRLQVGAAVVDNLDKLERYLFMAGDQKCVLQIQDLVYSRMQGGDGMGHAASPAAAPAPQPMAQPAPQQAPPVYAPPQYAQPVASAPVQPVQFTPLASGPVPVNDANIGLILDVPLQITVELGRTSKSIKDILELTNGSIVELDRLAGEPVDIMVNGKYLAKGEVVVIDENFGVRITDIASPAERAAKLQ